MPDEQVRNLTYQQTRTTDPKVINLAVEAMTGKRLDQLVDTLGHLAEPGNGNYQIISHLNADSRTQLAPHEKARWAALGYLTVDYIEAAEAIRDCWFPEVTPFGLAVPTWPTQPSEPDQGYPDPTDLNGQPDGYYPAGQPIPAKEEYEEIWDGWGLPTRTLLFGRAGSGKSTVASLIAGWYRTQNKRVLVICGDGEALDEWLDLRETHTQDWDIYDWNTRAGLIPYLNEPYRLQPWDLIIIDPLIGVTPILGLSEDDSELYRQVYRQIVRPLQADPLSHCLILTHTGWEKLGRPRGTSDAYGWPRLAMRYERTENEPTGRLTKTKANRTTHTYPTLAFHRQADGSFKIEPLQTQAFTPPPPSPTLKTKLTELVTSDPGLTAAELAERLSTTVEMINRPANRTLVKRDETSRPYRFYPLPDLPGV